MTPPLSLTHQEPNVTAVEDIIDSVADALDNVDEKPTDRQLWDLESVSQTAVGRDHPPATWEPEAMTPDESRLVAEIGLRRLAQIRVQRACAELAEARRDLAAMRTITQIRSDLVHVRAANRKVSA